MGASPNSRIATPDRSARAALNNTESMVRWVRKADGSYEYDFGIMDRYLDLYAAKAGKPGILQLYVWETQAKKESATLAVTVVDPAAIRVGQKLLIPPMDGLLVQVGTKDTLASLAANKSLAFGLPLRTILKPPNGNFSAAL